MQTATKAPRATQILEAEHEVILNVLDCLEKLGEEARASKKLDARSARDVLELLGTFADRCHHGKEEGVLFPQLVKKGLPEKVGPIAVMLAEHETGRAEIAGMRAGVAAWDESRPDATERFATHARAYVDLLRDHIAKENGVLFPMADGMLSQPEQEEILRGFAAAETHDMGAGAHERCLALAEELTRRLGVKPSARPTGHAGGCCGHASACH